MGIAVQSTATILAHRFMARRRRVAKCLYGSIGSLQLTTELERWRYHFPPSYVPFPM